MTPPTGSGVARVTPASFEGQRIRQRRVPVVAAEKDGIVSGHSIDHLARGQPGGGPRLLVPISAQQPAAGRERLCLLGDATREFFLAARIFQVNGEKLETAANEVRVAVNQPRHSEAALEVNDFGVRAGVGLNFGVAAHRQDAAIGDRHGFGKLRGSVLASRRFSRPNFSVQQNQVRAMRAPTAWLRGRDSLASGR